MKRNRLHKNWLIPDIIQVCQKINIQQYGYQAHQ